MGVIMKDSGHLTKFVALEHKFLPIKESILVSGQII
jgi:hypothetical protein